MYLDSMEFLEEERDTWRPYEALAELSDEQLGEPVEGAHGWTGRDLMIHVLAWQGVSLQVARELAVNETSPTLDRTDAEWDELGGDVVNARIAEEWEGVPTSELRERFRSQPGELRGYLTVVPETRWLKNARHLRSFKLETIDHYEAHLPDLEAILAGARR